MAHTETESRPASNAESALRPITGATIAERLRRIAADPRTPRAVAAAAQRQADGWQQAHDRAVERSAGREVQP